MTKYTIALLAVTCSVLAGCRKSEPSAEYVERMKTSSRIHQSGSIKGSSEIWLPNDQLPSELGWNPESGPPPISQSQAIEIAKDHFANSGETDLSLVGVGLHHWGAGRATNFWKYTVSLSASNGWKTAVILMDGRIFEPEYYTWEELGIHR